MILHTEGYSFPIERYKDDIDNTITEIFIGNPKCKPIPCIHITVYANEPVAVLQELVFFTSCSTSPKKFVRRSDGVKVMLRAALAWLLKKYTHVTSVEFSDNSYFKSGGNDIFMLPEKMVLTEGQTWYQKHFHAIPYKRTEQNLNLFVRFYNQQKQHFQSLPDSAWLNVNIANT